MNTPMPSSPHQKIAPEQKKQTNLERLNTIFIAILTLGVIIIPYYFFWQATAHVTLSPQSLKMIKSGMQPTLLQAITTTTVWPPGYPAVLFFGHQLHIPFPWINLALLYTTFIITFLFLRRFLTILWATAGVLGLTLFSFHYYNYAQFTSEALIIPLSLLILLLLIIYKEHHSWQSLWGMSLIAALAFVSRYHILAWMLPVVSLVLLLDRRFPVKMNTPPLRELLLYECIEDFEPSADYIEMELLMVGKKIRVPYRKLFAPGRDRIQK
jgi:hypothetical protein